MTGAGADLTGLYCVCGARCDTGSTAVIVKEKKRSFKQVAEISSHLKGKVSDLSFTITRAPLNGSAQFICLIELKLG